LRAGSKNAAVHALIGEAVREYRLSEEIAHWIELTTISESNINAIQHGKNPIHQRSRATYQNFFNGEIRSDVEDLGKVF